MEIKEKRINASYTHVSFLGVGGGVGPYSSVRGASGRGRRSLEPSEGGVASVASTSPCRKAALKFSSGRREGTFDDAMQETTMALFLYLLCQAIWTGAYADIKQWTSDTRFETPTNWASGRLPCSGQRASLAHSEALHVYLGSSVSVAGLVSPATLDDTKTD